MKARMITKITTLNILLLALLAHHSHVLPTQGTARDAECERVITDDFQAEKCLNSTIKAPPPIVLESTIINDFICTDRPTLYTFSCTVYGSSLVWYFNRKYVAGFMSNDAVGSTFRMSYPQSEPMYNITAMLTLVSNETFSRYNVPFCVSILTIQSFNESQADAPVIPFNVTCQTFCVDEGHTEVCQVKAYEVAETPTAPEEFTGIIQNISNDKIIGAKAIASLNWSLPDNENKTVIDFYEITLIGTHTNSTMSMRMTDYAQSLQTLSYIVKYMLSERNYTSASITAVDLCGQRSEPTQLELKSAMVINICVSSVDTQQSGNTVTVGAGVGVSLAVIIAFNIIICYHNCFY